MYLLMQKQRRDGRKNPSTENRHPRTVKSAFTSLAHIQRFYLLPQSPGGFIQNVSQASVPILVKDEKFAGPTCTNCVLAFQICGGNG